MPNEDFVDELVQLVDRLVHESGDPEEFDPKEWVEEWIRRPVPALGWKRPIEQLDTPAGFDEIKRIILRMQSGAYT